jgi:hypothetical protein
VKFLNTNTQFSQSLLFISLLASGILIPAIPASADQNSPAPGVVIENQATGVFVDSVDNSSQNVVSDKVKVTVAEVAGISATGSAITGTSYRSNVVYFDFLVKNEGNDPTRFFIPPTPSKVTIAGLTLPATNIGQLQVIEYNNVTTTTAITTNNLVNTSTGSTTDSLTGIPNSGSVPAGGYIKVRIPIAVPLNATIGDVISVTLGNTTNQPIATNTPYILGANGTGGNDLYTQDNPNTISGETSGDPVNGDATNHQQEASATQTVAVVAPPSISISGTVWDDANGSGTSTFTGIQNGSELGAVVTPAINAILVNSAGNVVATTPVSNTGTYTFSNIPGIQTGLFVILSTSTGTVNQPAPTESLPAAWTNTTPLTYAALPFDLGIANITGKDFGIDRLPDTNATSAAAQPNPPGATKYQVPALSGSDPEDLVLGTGKKFNIVTIPAAAQGILYYNNIAVVAGDTIASYDPTKLTFDPVDGNVSMSFTYAAIDAANKADPSPATATMSFTAISVSISGTIWNDKNNSANNTFLNIQSPGEVGTDAVFGTSTTPVNVLLVNTTTGFVLQTQVVATDGTYTFSGVTANTTVKIILAPSAGTMGAAPPTAAVPTGWFGTSPTDSGVLNSGFVTIANKDFGILQRAKVVLIKRITRINGLTTNPNDNTVLTGSSTDTFNNAGNWPAGYLVGNTNAGIIKPNDTIEYTVYFLNNQGADTNSVKLCDPIRGYQTYIADSIKLRLGAATSDSSLTDAVDTLDRANFYASGATPTGCNAGAIMTGSDNGGIAITLTGGATTNQSALTTIPGATGIGIPTTSYGLFRFTTKVNP